MICNHLISEMVDLETFLEEVHVTERCGNYTNIYKDVPLILELKSLFAESYKRLARYPIVCELI